MKNDKLPKGIRKRGKTYQCIVTWHGKQYLATCQTLKEAIEKRDNIKASLSSTNAHEHPTTHPITLIEAIGRAVEMYWEDTKGEKTAIINANILCNYFGKNTRLDTITTERVNAFIAEQKKHGAANSTINRKLSCLSVILKTAQELGFATSSPILSRRKEYAGRDRYITDEEERRLLSLMECWGRLDHALCTLLMIDTGARISETLRVTSEDIDMTQGKHGIMRIWETKNGHPRSVPLSMRLATLLRERDIHGKLFPSCSQSWYRVVWDRARHVMGLDEDVQFVPHILRHTCASRLVRRGVPLAIVQKWLGHRSIHSTMRYAHLAPEALYEWVE